MWLLIELLTFPFKVLFFPFKLLSWLLESVPDNGTDIDTRGHNFFMMRNQQMMNNINNRFHQQQTQRNIESSRKMHR